MSQDVHRQTVCGGQVGWPALQEGVPLRLTISCSCTTVLSVHSDSGHNRETLPAYIWVMLFPHLSGGSSRSFSIFHTGIHLSMFSLVMFQMAFWQCGASSLSTEHMLNSAHHVSSWNQGSLAGDTTDEIWFSIPSLAIERFHVNTNLTSLNVFILCQLLLTNFFNYLLCPLYGCNAHCVEGWYVIAAWKRDHCYLNPTWVVQGHLDITDVEINIVSCGEI